MKDDISKNYESVLSFKNVRFSYANVPVLDDVNFNIQHGEFAALVGQNGVGKTTIIRLLLGLEKPDEGAISVLGLSPKEARKSIGYLPQYAIYDPAFPVTVMDVVKMGRLSGLSRRFSSHDMEAVEKSLKASNVEDLASRSYAELSGGQRKRVLIARALAGEPKFLVMDEPNANMDAESEKRLFSTLYSLKGKITILIVTHDTDFVSSLTDTVLSVGAVSSSGFGRTIISRNSM